MRKKNVLWSVVLLLVLAACDKETQQVVDKDGRSLVHFTSVVEGDAVTRASGSSWAANDQIGVFMKQSGESLSSGTIVGGGDNTPYITKTGNGNFQSNGTVLEYPTDGSAVDFIAYYPYQSTLDNYIYKVDVTDQSKPEKIDLLYADNLVGRTQSSTTGNLQFYHQLSQVVLNLKSIDNTSLSGITVFVSDIKACADFNLSKGTFELNEQSKKDISMRVEITGTGAKAEALLIPQSVSKLTFKFIMKGKDVSVSLDLPDLKAAKRYTYTVNVKNGGEVIDPEAPHYEKWIETPVITKSQLEDANLMYVKHEMPQGNNMKDPVTGKNLRNYSMLFSKDLKIAYWVAYPLFNGSFKSGRYEKWQYDPKIDSKYQANLSSGFDGGEIYDRGHQIPNGDRNCNPTTSYTTFYYSNMTPQIGAKMNRTIWAQLEDKVRKWMSGTDTLFVVTGAIPPKSNIKRQKGMAVPEYYFKALARKTSGKFHTIAFKLNNEEFSYTDYMRHAISVSDLEELTGFTFFPSLDTGIKDALELNLWQ